MIHIIEPAPVTITSAFRALSGQRLGCGVACVIVSLLVAHPPVARAQSLDGETSPTVQPDTGELANRRLRLDYTTNRISLRIALPETSAASAAAPAEARGNGPLVIGHARELPREFRGDLSPHLDWTPIDDGSIVSALTVTSPGALGMRVGVRADMVPGAEIRFFSADAAEEDARQAGTDRTFPVVTREDFHEGGEPEILWSPTVEGEALGIEITLPSREALSTFSFRLERISHIHVSMGSRQSLRRTECDNHIDVQCRAGSISGHREHATGRISFVKNGIPYVCSGTLLSDDEEGSFIPYFLTANHCVSTGTVARTVEARWFFQHSSCDGAAVDSRLATTYGGADLLATSVAQDSTLLRFKRSLPGGLLYSGWSARAESHPISVYGIHHPAGGVKKYSAGTTTGQSDARVCEDPFLDIGCTTVRDAIRVDWNDGTTERGSSGSGLFRGRYLIGALSGGGGGCAARTTAYGPFSAFYPQVSQWLGARPTPPASAHVLPLVLPASSVEPQGFVRIINRSEQAGSVTIHAIDDTGRRFGPVALSLDSMQTKHLSSDDLERGNASKGLSGGVGDGTGHWRLELSTELDVEPVAYVRSSGGFLADVHEAAVEETRGSMRYRVPFFNPASNLGSESRLRLINPGDGSARVVISALDDLGEDSPGGDVSLELDAGAARMLTARQIEEGGAGLSGRLGDGTGKWQLSVASNRPIQVMSLIRSSTGLLANLSRGQAEGHADTSPPPASRQPDLVVESPSASTASPSAGQAITVRAIVRNRGDRGAAPTTLRLYRSPDATISTADTQVGTRDLDGLPASGVITVSIRLSAPADAGTYHYGACADFVSGESDTTNNCSSAVAVTVPGASGSRPDLVVESPTVSSSRPDAGQTITLGATVRNRGDGAAAPTILRWFRSSDATISTADAEVGSSPVGGVAASDASDESIGSSAPPSAGTWYYGACVNAVSGESDTTNNCSSGVAVTVRSSPVPPSRYYGAFALTFTGWCTDEDNHAVGLVVDRLTEQAALEAARQACRNDGGSVERCTPHLFDQRCLAIGYGVGGANGCTLGPGHGATLAEAEADKLSFCRDRQHFTNCTIVASACNSRTPPPPPSSQPDLVVESPTASSTTPEAGQRITLGATVRNQGGGEAAATTLRYYRSTDATISTADVEVGSSAVNGLAASGTSDESLGLNAPSDAGTYYYGACVDSVSEESDTANNCSSAVVVTVSVPVPPPPPPPPPGGGPDLVVESPTVSDNTPDAGQTITLGATVRNRGDGEAAPTTLRYYRSTDATISTADTLVDTDAVSGLAAAGASTESVGLTAPLRPRIYWYGACVDSVAGETDTANNCSSAVVVVVSIPIPPPPPGGGPDLVVESAYVAPSNALDGRERFIFGATVRNQGGGDSLTNPTLRYYLSLDATISADDTEVGTDSVAPLAVSGTSDEAITLTAPYYSGTYWYGACVGAVPGETDTSNNCSSAVEVTVTGETPPRPADLWVQSPDASPDSLIAGQSFTLSVGLYNNGGKDATATTLRWYRSADSTISTSDTEVGTDAVAALNAYRGGSESVELTAPSTPGTYWYGACVDSVPGETNTANNCSSGVAVTVRSAPPPSSGYYGAHAFSFTGTGTCTDEGSYSVGLVVDKPSELEALNAARQACLNGGGRPNFCTPHSFRQCRSVVYGVGGTIGCSLSPGRDSATLAEAEAENLAFCRDRAGFTSCSVVASACNSRSDGNQGR